MGSTRSWLASASFGTGFNHLQAGFDLGVGPTGLGWTNFAGCIRPICARRGGCSVNAPNLLMEVGGTIFLVDAFLFPRLGAAPTRMFAGPNSRWDPVEVWPNSARSDEVGSKPLNNRSTPGSEGTIAARRPPTPERLPTPPLGRRGRSVEAFALGIRPKSAHSETRPKVDAQGSELGEQIRFRVCSPAWG